MGRVETGAKMKDTIDAGTVAIVRDVVDGLVQGRKMFSAWEVAVISHKRRGADVTRKLMKEEVHNYFSTGNSDFSDNYQRDLVPVSDNKRAYVYHHYQEDPTEYQPLDRAAADPDVRVDPLAPAIPVPVVDGDDEDEDEDDDDDDNFGTDRLGRLRIPSRVLKEYGIQAGDVVNVGVDTLAQVTVVSRNGGDFAPISGAFNKVFQYKVDQYTNLRIGGTRLPKIRGNGIFKVKSALPQNDQLNVSPKDN